MSWLTKAIDLVLHVDKYLIWIIQNYGTWTYFFLFMIIFLETGLVVTPFLPGDSLIFATGALAAIGKLNIYFLFILLCAAAILGDTANYFIGSYIGPKIFERESKYIKKEYLHRTQEFFDDYGSKAIVLARFIPIIRTFAPFLAGIGKMSYWKFISYNIIGGVIWIALFLFGGFYFGNMEIVKNNFTFVILAIIIISLIPVIIEFYRYKYAHKKKN